MATNAIRFLRNGVPTQVQNCGPNETLLDYLRLRENCRGTKEGCGEGDCGACTIAIGSMKNGVLVYEPINACIQLLGQVHGKDIITVDDLASNGKLHPIQQAMVSEHGAQCGFCTPGIVMSLFTLYHSGEDASRDNVNDWLSGNLCRCTGYRPIADAASSAITGTAEDFLTARLPVTRDQLTKLDDGEDLFVGSNEHFFAAPASVESLAELCVQHDDATILSGATDVGLWITKQLRQLPKIIFTGRAKGFADVSEINGKIRIGAGVTYRDSHEILTSIDPDLGEIIRRIGSKPVRASGTIGGNIANGSPIGDMPPALIALDSRLELRLGSKIREIDLEDFFIAYGKQDRASGELVSAITIPRLNTNQHFRAYKISKRFDQDISSVLAAFRFELDGDIITDARLAYGGMAATPKRAAQSESALMGLSLNDENAIANALTVMGEDFTPMSDMRASADYRLKVAKNLLLKALFEIATHKSSTTRLVGIREAAQ